ncbi:MAG: GNAT family N-acetyltransferase [Treponema sp.]|nr:GNAT family N-acetyltransferase [Treponema sp.]
MFFTVELKSEKKIIGHIYFNTIEPKKLLTYEIGFIFNKKYQGKGFATEKQYRVLLIINFPSFIFIRLSRIVIRKI